MSGPVLVPTQFFLEPHRLEAVLWEARRDFIHETQRRGLPAPVLPALSPTAKRLIQDAIFPFGPQPVNELACFPGEDLYTALLFRGARCWAYFNKGSRRIAAQWGSASRAKTGCLFVVVLALAAAAIAALR